jgi:uncharacterized RDD family membrane protein YckC
LLLEDPNNCTFCDPQEKPQTASRSAEAQTQLDNGPEWQREVTRRLEQYRARRRRPAPEETQPDLPFRPDVITTLAVTAIEEKHLGPPLEPSRSRSLPRSRNSEHMEIRIQPEFDFAHTADDRIHPQTALVPVASLAERQWAGVLDLLFLGITCGGFLALFRSLGGQITLAKVDALVYASVLYLFYGLYFFVFTIFAGSTPGMQLRNLTCVRMDGSLPDTEQLLWRSFGYLLSAATLCLGFAWSFWDEDHFTWQDRISHTYITASMPLHDSDAADFHDANRHATHR